MSSYSLLGKADNLEDSSDDEVLSTNSPEDENGRFQVFRRRITTRSLLTTSIVLLVTLCVLLVVDITIRIRNGASKSPWNIESSYGRNFDYMSLDHKFDYLWDPELAGNNSIIKLSSDGKEDSTRRQKHGAIGMFHQIHCLTAFRKTLQRAREGEDIGVDQNDDHHWPHCFYYMRQAILCAADDTIEIAHGRNRGVINGVEDIRQCRNSSRLYELREKDGIWDH